jgi:hypothetical protein
VVAVNASAYFSRPGPRLIDGLELLAHILHTDLVPHATGEALAVELSGADGGAGAADRGNHGDHGEDADGSNTGERAVRAGTPH